MTEFVADHPGGESLIMRYAGKDVTEVMMDEFSHEHSDAAYQILSNYHVGYLSSGTPAGSSVNTDNVDGPFHTNLGTSQGEDPDPFTETDPLQDLKTHKFLDLNKPLLPQLWHGTFSKRFYLEQIHRPRHYQGGHSAPLFGNFLEPFTKTPWYVVPVVWLPLVAYGTMVGSSGFRNRLAAAAYWISGVCF